MFTRRSVGGDENGVESKTAEKDLLITGVLWLDLTDDISNASFGMVMDGVPGIVFSSVFIVVVNSASCFNVSAALLRPLKRKKNTSFMKKQKQKNKIKKIFARLLKK